MMRSVNLASLDLNLLVTLDALLRERNITRAGRRVGLSQPATSAALSRLRHMFDDALLVRSGRGYTLTPVAAALCEPVQQILVLIQRTLERRVPFDPASSERELRVAASDFVVMVLGPALAARLSTEAPRTRLKLRSLQSDAGRQLSARKLDLVIHPAGALPGFESHVLFEERWTVAAWRGNRQIGRRLDRARFEALPHVQFGLGAAEKTVADRALDAQGVERRVQVVTESFAAMPLLLRGSNRIAVMHTRLAKRLAPSCELRLYPLPFQVPPLVEVMSWHPLEDSDPAHVWFRGIVAEVAAAC